MKKKTATEKRPIEYETRLVDDNSLAEGTTKVRTRGINGVRTLTYEIVLTDGVETSRKLIRTEVTKQAVAKVVAQGTKTEDESGCDPNYAGCVPIASDVDCEGGSGNGPAYVEGPVRIIGTDIYRLDNDNDNDDYGTGCD